MSDLKKAGTNDSVGLRFFVSAIFMSVLLFMMGLWGVLSIYNATAFSDSPLHYAGLQTLWVSFGFFVLWASSSVPFESYERAGWRLVAFFYAALVLVLFFGGGVRGMRGWYDLGVCFVQPSEIAKPVFLFSLTLLLADGKWKGAPLSAATMAVTALWTLPIAAQPDFGTLSVYVLGFLLVFLSAGLKLTHLIPCLFFGGAASVLVFIRKPYVLDRVVAFLDPSVDPAGAGWHILQFKYTLARGGFAGRDWGGALWSNAYLPLPYSDSTFASLTESVGFLGALPVVVGYCVLAYLCYSLSSLAKTDSRRVFIFSVGGLVAAQALLHMSVNVGLFPPTGITLPMFSYGGSSLISTMFGFGMALSAAKP